MPVDYERGILKNYLLILHNGAPHQVVVSAVMLLVAIGDAVKVGEVTVEVNMVGVLTAGHPVFLASLQVLQQSH